MNKSTTSFGPQTLVRYCLVALLICSFVTSGCGPSQQELLMRSAQRSRGGDEDDPPPPTEKETEVAQAVETKPEPVEESAKSETEEKPTEEKLLSVMGDEIVTKKLVPIEDRKLKEPLSDDDRRERAYENLKSVSEALLAYMKAKGRLPATYKEADGFQTLSWRVEILPYLGYQELYDKFDPAVPWNRPPNDELLRFIPDEYVSPERFDTKTNLVMPSRRGFVGGDGGQLSAESFEDGMANTLLLVELNDKFAVDWTAPQDFAPGTPELARTGMLGLRKDGAFGVWANGWPVLLANELPTQVFWDAMTIEAGDGLMAGRVHRDIPIKNVTDASVAAAPEQAVNPILADASTQMPTPFQSRQMVRDDVPSASQLAAAQAKLGKIYAPQIKEAKADDDKLTLVKEMLDQSMEMTEDPTGAFALQTAAMRMAIEAGSIKEMLEAVDQRVGRFEVDAYDENMKWMLAFGKAVAQRDVESIQGMEYVKRAVKTAHAAIHDDDYVRASMLTRYAYRLVGQKRDEQIPKNLNRLRLLLGAAKREYDDAGESLAEFRDDPSNGNAAATVGRFLCFIKGDWETGLPLLTKGGNKNLRDLAELDLKGAADYMNKVALGDAWWELSEKARSGVYRQSARDRAVHWYAQAYPVMPDSLDKLHVKSRLDEAEDSPPSSPLALVEDLAENVSIDLTVGLAAVASVGQRGANRPYGMLSVDDDPDG